jgi:hypothetical protein
MSDEKRLHPFGLVRREVIGDHMDLFVFGLVGDDVGEKRDELRRGVALCGLAQYLAGLGVEGGIQGQRPMPVVLKAMALGAARESGSTGFLPGGLGIHKAVSTIAASSHRPSLLVEF